MKTYLWLALGLLTNLYAQTSTQSKDWIDLSNKSDAEIIKILEREVALLAESPAAEAGERVRLLQEQEKNAKQGFNQKTLLLEGELSLAASAKEAAEKAFADLQTDSTALSAQIDLYARSQQRLRERIDQFPFKAVVLAKAVYTGDLGMIKEKMIYEAGRLAIAQVNGVKIISETLVKNNILVSDIIETTIEGKADCQPREWKALENGTRRVIYLYGIYDIYPLAEGIKLSSQAAQLQLLVETHFVSAGNDAGLAALPANIQQEIRAMLSTTEQANAEVRNNLNALVQQEMQLLQNSGVTQRKEALKSKFDTLTSQMNSKRLDLLAKRQAYEAARKKLWDHLNGEQRIEIATQSDLERNRSQDVIKAKLMSECLTQFRTTVKSLYSQEKDKVVNFQLAESTAKNMFRQVQLKTTKVLGIYLSPSEGDIKYTASVAFQFGFEYTDSSGASTDISIKTTQQNLIWHFRSEPATLSVDDFGIIMKKYDFCRPEYDWNKGKTNPQGKGIPNKFKVRPSDQVVVDQATNLMWQQSGSSKRMKSTDAEKYISDLNAKRFAGFNDWRLPTLEEAMSLMEAIQLNGGLYIDPAFDNTQRQIWTADKHETGMVYVVYFDECHPGMYGDNGSFTVRAVRSVR